MKILTVYQLEVALDYLKANVAKALLAGDQSLANALNDKANAVIAEIESRTKVKQEQAK